MTALVERHGLTPPARATRFTAMVVVASPFMRETLVRSLRGLGAAEVVEAGSLAEARIRARGPAQRDLAIVDGTLPDGSGINLITELRSLGWSRALVMSTSEDPYTVRAALASGVRAFLVTPSATHEPARQPAGSPTPGRTGRASGAQGLSAREIEVLQLVSDGRSNKEIGEALGLSALTVKSHLARIARKLGTGDRAEMVVVAMRASVVV
ncbi:MAG: hypothetical protein QOE01_2141 [Actinomycetota bacterium]|nr:hypothetical protein [Actinomycetota bacterium]